MQRKQYGVNTFKWPHSRDIVVVDRRDMLLQIHQVTPLQEMEQLTSGEIVWCALNAQDFIDANDELKKALREEE